MRNQQDDELERFRPLSPAATHRDLESSAEKALAIFKWFMSPHEQLPFEGISVLLFFTISRVETLRKSTPLLQILYCNLLYMILVGSDVFGGLPHN